MIVHLGLHKFPLRLSDPSLNAQSSGSTIVVPATAVAEDYSVLFDWSTSTSSNPTNVTPSGWINVLASQNNNSALNISYKKLAAGDLGATITGMNGDEQNRKIMVVVRPSRSSVGASGVTNATINSTGGNNIMPFSHSAIIAWGFVGCGPSDAISGDSMTPTESALIVGAGTKSKLRYSIYNAQIPAVSIANADFGAKNCNACGSLRVF